MVRHSGFSNLYFLLMLFYLRTLKANNYQLYSWLVNGSNIMPDGIAKHKILVLFWWHHGFM